MVRVYLWHAHVPVMYARNVEQRAYITEIVNADYSPPSGSILIGVVSEWNSSLKIKVLGMVKSVTRVSQGRRRLRLEPVLFIESQNFEAIIESFSGTIRGRFEKAGEPEELRPIKLPPTAGAALLTALAKDKIIGNWLASMEEEAPAETAKLQELRESRDAIGLALEIADLPVLNKSVFSGSLESVVPDDVIASVVSRAHLADSEEDLIPEDLRRFKEDTQVSHIAGHVARFTGGGYSLLVFNVNKKPLEVALGVDLVYWDLLQDIFTLVQYKRLNQEEDASGRKDWVYKNENEIRRQLDLMVVPPSASLSADDWRMTSPYWFKFVRRDAARFQDAKLLKGMYVPADYLRLALEDETLRIGPRGGFRITYGNVKRLTRASFAELIQRGLIGTASAQSSDLRSVIENLGADGRSAIVAMKSRWTEPERQNDYDDLSSVFGSSRGENHLTTSLSLDDVLAAFRDGNEEA